MEDLAQPLTQNKKPFSTPATVGLPDIWSFIPKMAPVVGHGFLKSGPDTRILWQTAGGGSSSKGLFRKGRGKLVKRKHRNSGDAKFDQKWTQTWGTERCCFGQWMFAVLHLCCFDCQSLPSVRELDQLLVRVLSCRRLGRLGLGQSSRRQNRFPSHHWQGSLSCQKALLLIVVRGFT